MRLDKFLKVSRILKRRTVANEACDNDRVTVNGRAAKPSVRLSVGDEVTIRCGDKTVSAQYSAKIHCFAWQSCAPHSTL